MLLLIDADNGITDDKIVSETLATSNDIGFAQARLPRYALAAKRVAQYPGYTVKAHGPATPLRHRGAATLVAQGYRAPIS